MKSNKIILTSITILLSILTIIFILNGNVEFSVFSAIFLTFSIIFLVKELFEEKDKYKAEVKKILKTYDSILVEIRTLPKLSDKKIIMTKYFEDIVNAQYEIRKPIYYMLNEGTCDFILLDESEAYLYMLKKNNNYMSLLEDYLVNKDIDEDYIEQEYKAIEGLDKTSIIKIDDEQKYKVSPVRDK